jgi:hypothetical protein
MCVKLLVNTVNDEFEATVWDNEELTQVIEKVLETDDDYSITVMKGELWEGAGVTVLVDYDEYLFVEVGVDDDDQLCFYYRDFEPTNDVREVMFERAFELAELEEE